MVSAYFYADAIALIAGISRRQRSSYPKPYNAQAVQEYEQVDALHPPKYQSRVKHELARMG